MKRAGEASSAGKAELVCKADFQREEGYLYFLDHHGDLARAKRAVGGQKRKKPRPASNELSERPEKISASAGLLPGIDVRISHPPEETIGRAIPQKNRVIEIHQEPDARQVSREEQVTIGELRGEEDSISSELHTELPMTGPQLIQTFSIVNASMSQSKNRDILSGLGLLGAEPQNASMSQSKDRDILSGLGLVGIEPQEAKIPQPKDGSISHDIAQQSRVFEKREDLQVDVLIVTVTKVETRAVLQAFEQVTGHKSQTVPIGDRVYRNLGEVNGARVFLALSEMGAGGLGASQQAVRKGIEALRPGAVIMTGIAFGISEGTQAIGDILVSQHLRLYDLQRVSKDEIILRGDRPHASPFLVNHLQSAYIDWDGATVRFGLMLSGEKLVDNFDYREQLKHREPEAIGGEMEGAGLYVACHDAKIDWILVKAICDWADGNKSQDKDSRQQQAAQNAAAFLVHALQHAPLRRHRLYSAGTT